MFVEFITNGSITAQGWDASYTSTSAVTCGGVTNLTAASASFQMEVVQEFMIIT